MQRDDLAFAGAVRQAEMIRGGEVSSRELVELYLERIEQMALFRQIAIWKQFGPQRAVRFHCLEDLSTRKFAVQTADFFISRRRRNISSISRNYLLNDSSKSDPTTATGLIP